HEETPSYEFVPYRFGAFSFTSYADKRKMIEAGLLMDDEKNWTLTDAGQTEARHKPIDKKAVAEFCSQHSALRGDELIAAVYRRYPYYATRSKILDRVLPNLADHTQIDAARPTQLEPGLLTIGYEGKTLERYLNQLLKSSVTLLCDVRRNPLSRKYGFSKGSLSKACEGVGIRYEHLPELGIASSERGKLETQADYDALFARYEQACLPHQAAALQKIRNWIEHEGHRVALTCYEELPSMCHRQRVANAIERLNNTSLAQHL
ncbi:MAG: DUF488 family protein, partial [Nitrospirota bacterium]|nr:DUF488 family protein [Nitrospirota bacterium]